MSDMKWQPIETAPKDGYDYLVYNSVSEECFVAYRYGGVGSWYFSDRHALKDEPSHWMPLPKPPKEDE